MRLEFTKGQDGNASIGFTLKSYELPELPESFNEGMSKVFYDENNPKYGTDEDVFKFRKFVAKELNSISNIVDPEDDEDEETYISPKKPDGKSASRVEEMLGPEKEKPNEEKPKKDRKEIECPGKKENPKLDFGKYPGEDDVSVECISCQNEALCIIESKK
jgi:hypothetical protein